MPSRHAKAWWLALGNSARACSTNAATSASFATGAAVAMCREPLILAGSWRMAASRVR